MESPGSPTFLPPPSRMDSPATCLLDLCEAPPPPLPCSAWVYVSGNPPWLAYPALSSHSLCLSISLPFSLAFPCLYSSVLSLFILLLFALHLFPSPVFVLLYYEFFLSHSLAVTCHFLPLGSLVPPCPVIFGLPLLVFHSSCHLCLKVQVSPPPPLLPLSPFHNHSCSISYSCSPHVFS